ncbi:MAG: rhs element Vgr protein [Paracoccus denitrificans]|nr:MAG: rhs element Vgr protein [Paracoccus denitrificans]PZO84310.1 MAG: rhs element Vgr protein [Paracoccus denitrificans]
MTDSPSVITSRALAAARSGSAVGTTAQSCPRVTLEIGVFFDGTGNNQRNARQGTEGSYANAASNVALLSRIYKNEEKYWKRNSCGGFERKYARIYKDGIGTIAGGSDSLVGMGTGMGDYGVEARVFDACLDVGRVITRLSPNVEPLEVVLDVFGFSRGAAAARYFVNCFRQGYVEYWRKYVSKQRAYLPAGRKVRIRYVGIFDTVAAIGVGMNEMNGAVNVHVSTAQANRIFHLVATNEYRANFRLNHNLPGGGVARSLPGAHSDVGGGYGDPGDRVKVYSGTIALLPTRESAEKLARDQQSFRGRTKADREATWVRIGFLNPNEPAHGYVDVGSIKPRQLRPLVGPPRQMYEVDSSGYIDRPWVQPGLSRIPLRIMYNDALRAGVPLTAFPDGAQYRVPAGLQPVAAKLIAGASLSEAERRSTLRNFGHISANRDNFGMWADSNYTRVVYPNQPGKAK